MPRARCRPGPWLVALAAAAALGVTAAVAQTRTATAAQALAPQGQEQRLALVVGNAAYRDAPLRNAANDARAMAAALREAGFTVVERIDADHRTLVEAAREFGDRLRQGGGVGVFYYAGHGMQIKGRNYLVPVGAEIRREDEVAYAALDAQAVLDKMETAGNAANLMILDACRNNPFARSFRSSTQGLAQMEAPVGTLIAFATAPGAVASDGADANGLYTQHLLKAMRQRGAKVEDVFKQVRAAVRRESQGRQVPWEATSLEGDLVIFPAARTSPAGAAAPPPPASRVAPAAATPAASKSAIAMPAPPPAAATPPRPRPPAAANAQGYTVGDRWNYQVIDRWRGEVVRNYRVRVRNLLPDGGWESDSGMRFDAEGRLQAYRGGDGSKRQLTPHIQRWWPDMQVGERRRFDFQIAVTLPDGRQTLNRVEGEARFAGIETVKVPAGEFQARRFEYQGLNTAVGAHGRGTLSTVTWYVPELHTMVAYERESTWNGHPDAREREELTSYTLARPPR